MTDRETAVEMQEFNDPIEAIKFYMAEAWPQTARPGPDHWKPVQSL